MKIRLFLPIAVSSLLLSGCGTLPETVCLPLLEHSLKLLRFTANPEAASSEARVANANPSEPAMKPEFHPVGQKCGMADSTVDGIGEQGPSLQADLVNAEVPNTSPEPMPGTVTPRAIERVWQ